jgi:hypothetical protein
MKVLSKKTIEELKRPIPMWLFIGLMDSIYLDRGGIRKGGQRKGGSNMGGLISEIIAVYIQEAAEETLPKGFLKGEEGSTIYLRQFQSFCERVIQKIIKSG